MRLSLGALRILFLLYNGQRFRLEFLKSFHSAAEAEIGGSFPGSGAEEGGVVAYTIVAGAWGGIVGVLVLTVLLGVDLINAISLLGLPVSSDIVLGRLGTRLHIAVHQEFLGLQTGV